MNLITELINGLITLLLPEPEKKPVPVRVKPKRNKRRPYRND